MMHLNGIKKAIKRPNALKGNDRIGLMKPFVHFSDEPTNGQTHALMEMRGRI